MRTTTAKAGSVSAHARSPAVSSSTASVSRPAICATDVSAWSVPMTATTSRNGCAPWKTSNSATQMPSLPKLSTRSRTSPWVHMREVAVARSRGLCQVRSMRDYVKCGRGRDSNQETRGIPFFQTICGAISRSHFHISRCIHKSESNQNHRKTYIRGLAVSC